MRYWNKTVNREECTVVQTQLVSYRKRKRIKQSKIKEIEIDCSNGQKYLIYNAYINDNLINALSELSENASIMLLIHPNSDQIVEVSDQNGTVMSFDETMNRLKSELFLFFRIIYVFLRRHDVLQIYIPPEKALTEPQPHPTYISMPKNL